MAKFWNHRFIQLVLAFLLGASATLAFAPYQLWLFAFVSLTGLLVLIDGKSTKQGLALGYAWGWGQFVTGISWVHVSIDNFGGLPKVASLALMAGLIGYLAIYPALFAGALNRWFNRNKTARLLLAAPALWLINEWLRGWVMTGFPWLWLGYSQIDSPLATYAPIGGVDTISYVIALSSGAIALALISKRFHYVVIPACLFGVALMFNGVNWVTPNPDSKTHFALIQGNIAQELKWMPNQRWPTIMKYTDITRENWDADIIIWPEAAIPAFESELPSYLHNLDSAGKLNDAAIITGIITQPQSHTFHNSILSLGITEHGDYNYNTQPRYNKHHLLPFGEFVPFEDWLRPIAPFFNLPMSSFSRGDFVQANLEANGRYFAPALCYEIIFNDQVRQNVTEETDYILTLSNDAWFGHSIGPLQHMEIARMRALELGKPVVRATNNGVTAITDYQGKIIAAVPQFETQVLRAKVESTTGMTPYRLAGTMPLQALVLIGLIAAWVRRFS
ncbi:apolipoprotein N-acyltransferase [Vibrio sp. SCSIO 43136]|uniref:apolipoprotein N-acyltransferase n=1 Tax=Vibrio sp. SCSIO 43136 TaxID=2819101 RepID=UPI002074D7C6|nr:apolipoprotein N-acyltransferase [Vibrio sp. SCSIO 43136]USD64654.1 apolipoprotein N-acyltransferase [Vibrio sp. SCSIO 43136]